MEIQRQKKKNIQEEKFNLMRKKEKMNIIRQKKVSASEVQVISQQLISQQNTYGYDDKQIYFDQQQLRSQGGSQRNLNINNDDENWRLKKIIEDQLCLIVLMSAELETLRLQEKSNQKLNQSGIQRSTIQASQVWLDMEKAQYIEQSLYQNTYKYLKFIIHIYIYIYIQFLGR